MGAESLKTTCVSVCLYLTLHHILCIFIHIYSEIYKILNSSINYTTTCSKLTYLPTMLPSLEAGGNTSLPLSKCPLKCMQATSPSTKLTYSSLQYNLNSKEPIHSLFVYTHVLQEVRRFGITPFITGVFLPVLFPSEVQKQNAITPLPLP